MFQGCYNLTSVDLSHFNTSKVISMGYMFFSCSKLASLDLTSFNTGNVTNMFSMFLGCEKLKSLDLSSFNTSKVTNMSWMFYSCKNLKTIIVDKNWSTTAVTESTNMFAICSSLVGGAGTTYDDDHVDAAYAHIDGGPSNPGYLTSKSAQRGDVNGDGKVNVSDVTTLVNMILGIVPKDAVRGDLNGDGKINVTDVTTLVNIILGIQ
jgi:surface protein